MNIERFKHLARDYHLPSVPHSSNLFFQCDCLLYHNEAYDDFQKNVHDARINFVNAELGLISIGTEAGAFGTSLVKVLNSKIGQTALQTSALATTAYDCATAPGGKCYSSVEDAILQIGTELKTQFNSATQGFAIVSGSAQIPFETGMVPAQNLVQFSSTGVTLNTLADPNGNFQLFVPLNVDPFTYAGTDLQIIDPVSRDIVNTIDLRSGQSMSSQVIDLSGLTTKAPFQVPTIRLLPDCYKTLTSCQHQCDTVWDQSTFTLDGWFKFVDCYTNCYNAWAFCTGYPLTLGSLFVPAGVFSLLTRLTQPINAACSPKSEL